MKRAFILTAAVLATLLLLVLAGAGIFLATFNPNEYKQNISDAVYKATGRQIQLQGNLEVSIFPWLGLTTGKFLISDPPAFGADPFISAENASFHLALMPLLTGSVEVKEIHVQGARLKLVETTTGQKNWDLVKPADGKGRADDTGVAKLDDAAKPEEPKSDGKSMKYSVASMLCEDVEVVYRNLAEGASYRLAVHSLELENLRPDADMPLNLSGLAADEKSGLKADFSLKARIHMSSGGDISGKIESLRVTAEKEKASLPASLALRFAFSPERKSLSLDDIQGTLHDAAFSGSLNVALPGDASPGLGVKGTLAIAPVNLDALLDAVAAMNPSSAKGGGAPNMGNETVAGKRQPEGPQRVEKGDAGLSPALKNLDADLTVTAKSVTVAKLTFTDISAHVQSEKGKAKIPYSLKMYSGTVSGTATADLRQNEPAVALNNSVKDVAVGDMLYAVSGKRDLSGTLSSALDVKGQGLEWKKLAPTLGGKGNVLIAGGEIKGFTLIPQGLPNVPAVPVNFSVNRISDSFTITKGVLSTNDFVLDSSAITGSGGGTVNLINQGLALTLRFLLAGQPPAVPVVVTGSLSAPSYSVDMVELVKGAAVDVLQSPERAKDLLTNPDSGEKLIRGVEGLFKK